MISLLCPTRGRHGNLKRFIASARDLAHGPIEIVVYQDRDDSTITDLGDDVVEVIGPRIVLAECWNRCAEVASGDIFGHMGDDVVFHTDGWDTLVSEVFDAFPDRIALVHGRDGVHDEHLGTHGFVSREWYDAVGYFTPPYFSHDYCDTWLNEVADRIGRRVFVGELDTEHLHPDVGKAPMDDTYREHAAAGERDGVSMLYDLLEHKRRADAEKLRAVMR